MSYQENFEMRYVPGKILEGDLKERHLRKNNQLVTAAKRSSISEALLQNKLVRMAAATVAVSSLNLCAIKAVDIYQRFTGTPSVVPGLPFRVTDSYATQVCVSSNFGQPLPPFVVPDASTLSSYPKVKAWIPFLIQDTNGTQICVSTRSGRADQPYVIPISGK